MEEHDNVSGGFSPIPRSDLKVTSLLLLLHWIFVELILFVC